MALGATVHKIELSISDMDRNYYATHALTIARHPSETEARLMTRILAFALHADERLEFGRGLSDEDEPALWRKSRTGEIEQWIDVGQPDETRIRRACGRAGQVVVINYSGRAADLWWSKIAASLERHRNLGVLDIDETTVQQLAAQCVRSMQVQCLIQDGEVQWINGDTTLGIRMRVRMASRATA